MQVTRQSQRNNVQNMGRMQVSRQSQRNNVQNMGRMQVTRQSQRNNVQNMGRMQVSPIVKKKAPSQSLGRQMLNIKK